MINVPALDRGYIRLSEKTRLRETILSVVRRVRFVRAIRNSQSNFIAAIVPSYRRFDYEEHDTSNAIHNPV